MPITSSAKKALRQNIKLRAQNISRKQNLGNTIRKYKKMIIEKNLEEAKKILPLVFKSIDKTAKTGFIKKNKAARLKSRLSKKLSIK